MNGADGNVSKNRERDKWSDGFRKRWNRRASSKRGRPRARVARNLESIRILGSGRESSHPKREYWDKGSSIDSDSLQDVSKDLVLLLEEKRECSNYEVKACDGQLFLKEVRRGHFWGCQIREFPLSVQLHEEHLLFGRLDFWGERVVLHLAYQDLCILSSLGLDGPNSGQRVFGGLFKIVREILSL